MFDFFFHIAARLFFFILLLYSSQASPVKVLKAEIIFCMGAQIS